jgi:uncharacterized membrane-anchored protein YitT (DUF2179 family)
MKHFFKEQLFPVIMIIVGAACAAFSIECFLITNCKSYFSPLFTVCEKR